MGWRSSWVETVLGECLAVVLAWRGGTVAELTSDALDEFASALSCSAAAPSSRRAYRSRLASLRQLLFETAGIDTAPQRRRRAGSLEQRFTEVAMPTPIRQTLLRYIHVRAAVLRPKSVESLINDLLLFAEYLTAHHPDVISLHELDHLGWNRTRGWRGQRAAAGAGRTVSAAVAQSAVLSLRNLLDDIPHGPGSRPHRGAWSSPPTSPNSTSRCRARWPPMSTQQ